MIYAVYIPLLFMIGTGIYLIFNLNNKSMVSINSCFKDNKYKKDKQP